MRQIIMYTPLILVIVGCLFIATATFLLGGIGIGLLFLGAETIVLGLLMSYYRVVNQ